jgi:glucosamine--fructose-6-phosphate aminotransferase (isomerizing)
MGSSYDACYPASTWLAAAGIAAPMHDSAELLHFRLGALGGSDLLILVSQSGESAETLGVARALRERTTDAPTIVTVTNGTANTLARLADVALDTRAGEETGPSTMTFAAALVLMGALSRAMGGEDAVVATTGNATAADDVADAIGALLADDGLPDRLRAWLGARDRTVILGRGAARAAAEMGALTVKEAVGIPVEALQTAQFRHGPLELAGPGLAAIVIATEPATAELDHALADELARLGSAVLFVSAGGSAPAGVTSIDVGPLDRLLCPAAAIVPIQLLAWRLSIAAGRSPGSYVHASKVTTRE